MSLWSCIALYLSLLVVRVYAENPVYHCTLSENEFEQNIAIHATLEVIAERMPNYYTLVLKPAGDGHLSSTHSPGKEAISPLMLQKHYQLYRRAFGKIRPRTLIEEVGKILVIGNDQLRFYALFSKHQKLIDQFAVLGGVPFLCKID